MQADCIYFVSCSRELSVPCQPLPVSPTEYLHFFLTAELQGSAFLPPVHDGLQLFLDALRRDLPPHNDRGGHVHRGAAPALVLSPRLGYVFPPAEF